jgi:phosphoserine phosphatase RsbU/P
MRDCPPGHHPPLLVRHDATCCRLEAGGPLLGVFPDGSYELGIATLHAGDRFVLFTDGITEASGAGHEQFGERRLIDVVQAHITTDAPTLLASIMEAARSFGAGRFGDDATAIVLAVQ